MVGDWVGDWVGDELGVEVVGNEVGDEVGDEVGVVGDEVGDEVGDAVGDKVHSVSFDHSATASFASVLPVSFHALEMLACAKDTTRKSTSAPPLT